MLRNCFDEVMQALRHEYPAFSAFKSITEESKKETTTVATSQLTSNLGSKSLKVKVKKKQLNIQLPISIFMVIK